MTIAASKALAGEINREHCTHRPAPSSTLSAINPPFVSKPDRARAREAKRNQDQGVDFPGFRVQKTGGSRVARADRQRFCGISGRRSKRGPHIGSPYVPFKVRSQFAGQVERKPHR
jgi:hypothetical protein